MARHPCRPDLRFELPAARSRGRRWVRGFEGEAGERLRGGVDQSDEPRSLRPRLSSAKKKAVNFVLLPLWIGKTEVVAFPGSRGGIARPHGASTNTRNSVSVLPRLPRFFHPP